jgi:lipopolysaccharide/colanic/teichoic acid biosynthesis glycosyltransferase
MPKTGEEWLHSRGKRIEDLTLATTILPLAAPAAVAGSLAVAVFDRVNPSHSHERLGYNAEPFTIHKIKTMPKSTENVPSGGIYNDPRASRVGRVLRKTRIDEAPQIINVYKGEMSIFGPRAMLAVEWDNFRRILGNKEANSWQDDRSLALPGIFDEFSINYHAGEVSDDTEIQLLERIETERRYIFEEASLAKDMELYRKVWGLFFRTVVPFAGDDTHA